MSLKWFLKICFFKVYLLGTFEYFTIEELVAIDTANGMITQVHYSFFGQPAVAQTVCKVSKLTECHICNLNTWERSDNFVYYEEFRLLLYSDQIINTRSAKLKKNKNTSIYCFFFFFDTVLSEAS